MTPPPTPPDRPHAAAGFRRVFGREPSTTWFAPGRVNIIGEHTDYNAGLALPFAIHLGVSTAVGLRDDDQFNVVSQQVDGSIARSRVSGDALQTLEGWARYVGGVQWAMLREQAAAARGADVFVDGSVPAGAGLSSSAALTCSVAAALGHAHAGPGSFSAGELVDIAVSAENDFVGMPCGRLDQTSAVHAREGHAMLFDAQSDAIAQLRVDVSSAGGAFVVVPLTERHELVDGPYGSRRIACERAAAALGVASLREIDADDLRRARQQLDADTASLVRHVVTENARVAEAATLLSGHDLPRLGALLTQSHASLRDDFRVSTPEADALVDELVSLGAYGARIVGGGFGGSVLALSDVHRLDRLGRLGRPHHLVTPQGGIHEQVDATP